MRHHRSIHLFIFFALLTSACQAQGVPPAPPELRTLKTRYQSALQTAREPIRVKYIDSLGALLRSITKDGDLDAGLAVQQELNAVTGKPLTANGGKITPELTALKAGYAADVQAASEALQTRYIASLETLQDTLTKRGKLNDAVSVRQEAAATKAEGNVRIATAIPPPIQVAPPAASVGVELSRFLPGTKWIADQKDGFVKEISFTMDGNLIRKDQSNNTLRTTYQMGSDVDSVSYKKADGKDVPLRFSADRRSLTIGAQTFKQMP